MNTFRQAELSVPVSLRDRDARDGDALSQMMRWLISASSPPTSAPDWQEIDPSHPIYCVPRPLLCVTCSTRELEYGSNLDAFCFELFLYVGGEDTFDDRH